MNSRSAPAGVNFCHLDDQPANLLGDSRSTRTTLTTLPSPEKLEALAMPDQNGGWPHHGQRFYPTTPEAGEQRPEGAVDRPQLGPRPSVYQARDLMAQSNVLRDEICSILEDSDENGEHQWELEGHLAEGTLKRNEQRRSAVPVSCAIMTRDTGKAPKFAPVRESSGESRIRTLRGEKHGVKHPTWAGIF